MWRRRAGKGQRGGLQRPSDWPDRRPVATEGIEGATRWQPRCSNAGSCALTATVGRGGGTRENERDGSVECVAFLHASAVPHGARLLRTGGNYRAV